VTRPSKPRAGVRPVHYKCDGTYTRKGDVVTFIPSPEPGYVTPILTGLDPYEEGEYHGARYTRIGDLISFLQMSGSFTLRLEAGRWEIIGASGEQNMKVVRMFRRWMNGRKQKRGAK